MVRGGRSGRGSTSSSAPSTSVGRGSTPIGSASPTTPIVLATMYLIVFNRRRQPSSSNGGGGSASWTPAMLDFWREDRSRTCFPLYYIVAARTRSKTSGLMERVPPVRPESLFDMFTRRYMFTRPEDLPRARVV
ncbi:hypothetical protein Taro_046835 [Colocasia esculenta]|uniref:Uncharacterized protein n=1 Tax=Colocasia esculenta TaxID=4460 RepID=A0A843X6L0_COLES|nr:hypothetical protein [Colocasia esculenta]